MKHKYNIVESFKYYVEEGSNWVCDNCAEIVPHNALCPKCSRNRVVLFPESSSRKLLTHVEYLESIISNLIEELSPLARTDHFSLVTKSLVALGLNETQIKLYFKGELML